MSATMGSISIGDSTIQMPVKAGTIGPSVVDIGKLYAHSGMFTYDPGFTSTASCESEITYIDGDEGVPLYRGYPIEQIAEHADFLETCYLLLYGQLPTSIRENRATSPSPARSGSRGRMKAWRLGGPPRGFHDRFRLSERQARMIEEDSAGVGQLDTTSAARQQLCANLIFQVADLTAERRLGCM